MEEKIEEKMEDVAKFILSAEKKQFDLAAVKPVCEVGKSWSVMLPMSDGVHLETKIWLPDQEQKDYPIILKRNCYSMQIPMLELQAKEYARRGFGFVVQSCRGTMKSEGVWEPNVNERQDGLDTLEWLSKQPFVRNIGYWGDSYLALTGWCMLDAVPEKVKTMFLGVYGIDRHTSAYQDGMFRHDVLTSWAKENAGKPIDADTMESYRFRPQMEVDEKLWGVRLDWYRDWISNPDRESDYWNTGFWEMLKEIPGKTKIPIFVKEGWYDHHLGSALVSYDRLPENIKKKSVLEIGPWNHYYLNVVTHGKCEYALKNEMEEPLVWFEKILMKEEMPIGKIEEYVIGADTWIEKEARTERGEKCSYYLDAESQNPEKGMLKKAAPCAEKAVSYEYDPDNPLPSHGAESMLTNMQENGSLEQPALGWRADVVSFQSEPLEQDLTIDGAVKVRLYVSSDAEDTAFTAKIMEVFEDGTVVNVRGSITTLAYRGHSGTRQEYQPGEIVEVEIDMWDIAWKFQKGSRIRLDISSSDFPQYSVHTNYAGVWSKQCKTKTARQTVYTGAEYPSRVELPMMKK